MHKVNSSGAGEARPKQPDYPKQDGVKRCTKCKATKPTAEFSYDKSRWDGLNARCRECDKEILRKRDNARFDRAKRQRHGWKDIVRSKVHAAVKNNIIPKLPCERCGEAKSQAHHEDYSKPLEVIWLCQTHHAERHRELRDMPVVNSTVGEGFSESKVLGNMVQYMKIAINRGKCYNIMDSYDCQMAFFNNVVSGTGQL